MKIHRTYAGNLSVSVFSSSDFSDILLLRRKIFLKSFFRNDFFVVLSTLLSCEIDGVGLGEILLIVEVPGEAARDGIIIEDFEVSMSKSLSAVSMSGRTVMEESSCFI